MILEHAAQRLEHVGLVLDGEHALAIEPDIERRLRIEPPPRTTRVHVERHRLRVQWQPHAERGAASLARTLRADLPAVQLHQLLHDRETEPSPPNRRVLELSAWRKRLNTCGRNSALMPTPSSRTSMFT